MHTLWQNALFDYKKGPQRSAAGLPGRYEIPVSNFIILSTS